MNNESRGGKPGTGAPEGSLCWWFISQTCDGLKIKPGEVQMTQQTGNLHQTSLVTKELTFYADDFRSVPLAIGAALSSWHVALQEAFGALVADYRVDVVVGALPTNQEGVIHRRRGSTKH